MKARAMPSKLLRRSLLLGLLAVGGHAQAQTSNITIYGYLDIGVQSVAGYDSGNVSSYSKDRKTAVQQGYRNWIGVSGVEALGGGWATTFNLQMRFMPDTGAIEEPGGTLFQGESTLGLSSKTVGAFRVGRDLTPFWAQKWLFDPWYDSEFMGSVGAYQNGSYNSDPTFSMGYANWGRMQSAVFYDSNPIAGFTVHAASQVGTAKCAPTPTVACHGEATGKVQSVTVKYTQGPLLGALSWEKNNVGDTVDMLGLSYKFGSTTLMGTLGTAHLETSPNQERNATLAATYELTPSHTLRFGFGRSSNIAGNGAGGNGGGPPGSTQTKFSFGDNYALSARTHLYADIWHENIATVPTANGVGIGINHTF